MLYNHESDLTTTEERIKNSNISKANKKLIFEFESYSAKNDTKIVDFMKILLLQSVSAKE